MRIAFYTPFKPLNHARPSGDLVIARGLYRFLTERGHEVWPVGPLRTRWIYWTPWRWPHLVREYLRSLRQVARRKPDLWLTYHTYYKAPDLLGPYVTRHANIPYVIFQGIFSTKRRRKLRTWPGYVLNRQALCAARHIFTNRHEDWVNLRRLIPEEGLTYVRPGIEPTAFASDAGARAGLRRAWGIKDDEPVILSAAMFRPDVKTEGLAWVIRACGRLFREGISLHLVIAGDGKERDRLRRLAKEHLPGRVRFAGKIPREKMYRFYSAGDLFVFPGIRESLGMVFLESQACGLPVLAFDNGGIPEVVRNNETGLLVPLYDQRAFDGALKRLILEKDFRQIMGCAARSYVRQCHDLSRNYQKMETMLRQLTKEKHHDV